MDLAELNSAIKKSGIKKSHIANTLHITQQSLSLKLSGKVAFKLYEVKPIAELLNLDDESTVNIFLS